MEYGSHNGLGKPLRPGYNDLNGDGINDALLFVWNGKTALFVADDGRLPWTGDEHRNWSEYFNRAFDADAPAVLWNELRADFGSYTILVDRDGCGRFDSPGDFYYKVLDLDGDGRPEAEYYHLVGYPGFQGNDPPWSNKLHVVLDGERDISYLNFRNFSYGEEQEYDKDGKYYMNVHGNGFFLNSYSPDPRLSWEVPIAWYDFDFDGHTNMIMRAADTRCEGGFYSGKIGEFEVGFELNGNTGPGRFHSLDFQLTFYSLHGQGLPYEEYTDHIARLAPLVGSEYLSEGRLPARGQTERSYLPYLDGYRIGTDFTGWEGCWMIFDEDDDDNRWEEMFSPHETAENATGPWGAVADQLGDRVERDLDFGGGGQVYVAAFDNRIHLYHAEEAYWDIDYYGVYRGAADHPFDTEGPRPPDGLLCNRVRYYDTDGDGFLDRIEYGDFRFGDAEASWTCRRTVNLLDYSDAAELARPLTGPRVVCPLTGWRLESWDGKPFADKTFEGTAPLAAYRKYEELYAAAAEKMWADAMALYTCAKQYRLNRSEAMDMGAACGSTCEELLRCVAATIPRGYSRHLDGSDRRARYNNGYWLREKVFEDILTYSGLDAFRLSSFYYRGEISGLCGYIASSMS